jgi:hypothetical protein
MLLSFGEGKGRTYGATWSEAKNQKISFIKKKKKTFSILLKHKILNHSSPSPFGEGVRGVRLYLLSLLFMVGMGG